VLKRDVELQLTNCYHCPGVNFLVVTLFIIYAVYTKHVSYQESTCLTTAVSLCYVHLHNFLFVDS